MAGRSEEVKFDCDGCGFCCERVGDILKGKDVAPQPWRNIINAFPHSVDDSGVCMKFDKEKGRCTVYKRRPLMCSVSKLFDLHPEVADSKASWFALNKVFCRKLKEDGKKR